MNRNSVLTQLLPALGFILCAMSSAAGQQAGWHETLSDAESAARRDGVPLLIHFHAWYCAPCRQMDSQVFHHGDVQAALSRDLHAVQIDVTRDPDAAARYQATTVPRDVVVYPDGTVETLNVGFVSRSRYLAMLSSTAERGQQMRQDEVPLPQSRSNTTAIAGVETGADSKRVAETAASTVEASPTERVLGLDGYSPVALTDEREWVKGDPGISSDYRGVTYHFPTVEERAVFEQNPRRYAPQNLGCDPVLLLSDQRAISGRIQYGAFFDGNLYLFRSEDNRALFRKNPLRYTRIRHAVRVDQIEGRRVL
jgi:YHS domain-containing protein